MIKAECDRCGIQLAVEGVEKARISLPAPFSAVLPRLPLRWTRLEVRTAGAEAPVLDKHLCQSCTEALRAWLDNR